MAGWVKLTHYPRLASLATACVPCFSASAESRFLAPRAIRPAVEPRAGLARPLRRSPRPLSHDSSGARLEEKVTQVFAPQKAGREGIPEGPVRPTRHPTHDGPNGQVNRVIRINAPHSP